jgi:hypothetical protein
MQREAVGRVGYRVGILLFVVLKRSVGKIRDGKVPEIYWLWGNAEDLECHILESVAMHVSRRVHSREMPAEVPPFARSLVRSLVLGELHAVPLARALGSSGVSWPRPEAQ